MAPAPRLALVLGLLLLGAGCLSGQATTKEDLPGDATADPTTSGPPVLTQATFATAETGGIEGYVLDGEQRPIEGALVELLGTNQTTNTTNAGSFAFNDLSPQPYYLSAKHPNFTLNKGTADVVAGAVAKVIITLDAIPPPQTFIDDGYTYGGYVPVTGCVAATATPTCYGLAQQKGVPVEYQAKTDARIPVTSTGWTVVLAEIEWEGGTSYASTLKATLFMPVRGDTGCQGEKMVAETVGSSPLTIRFTIDDYAAIRAADDTFCDTGKDFHVRIDEWSTSGPTLFVDQDFTLYGTVSYNGPLPETYSRLPS